MDDVTLEQALTAAGDGGNLLPAVTEPGGESGPSYLLPSGEALTAEETYPISAAEKTRFSVIAGAVGSGKTSLAMSIYSLFLLKELPEDYCFAGSKTLAAFERLAYYARISSGQESAGMRRTPRGALNSILHLRLKERARDAFCNLLMTDLSGEDYDGVLGDAQAAKEEFPMLRSAHCLILLADGDKIRKPRRRSAEIQKLIHLLKTFCGADGGLLRPEAPIIVTVSKYDLISTVKNSTDAEAFIEFIPELIAEQIPQLSERIYLSRIASMPDDSSQLKIGYGVQELLEQMLHLSSPAAQNGAGRQELHSQFNLWGERWGK